MIKLLAYLALFGLTLYLLSLWGRVQQNKISLPRTNGEPAPKASNRWFKKVKNPREVWIQVYETASLEEARLLQARLQEDEVECVLYEQGKKDIHGNPLKGIGIAVPKTAAPHAQNIISRMPT